MEAEILPPVQRVLSEYITLVNDAVPGLLVGLYLHGSLALGAFDPGFSDIDFIAITSRRYTHTDIGRQRAAHATLRQRHPQLLLEGSYLQWSDHGGREDSVPPHPHSHDGVLHASGHHDINGVTWWMLKHRGIALIGPPPAQLEISVDWDDLIAKMHENMNSYWASFTADPRRLAWLSRDYGIQWSVLGVLRQFYSFRERAIASKVEARRYALAHTPRQWHQLIQEAINIRTGVCAASYRSRIVRAMSARAFLQLVITACNTCAAGGQAAVE